jgi:hypothetical protein
MLENLALTTFVALAFGIVIFILLMFLPALLELRKPRDAGPRKIMDDIIIGESQMKIASIEKSEEIEIDQALVKKMANVLSVLPNLET